MNRADPHEAAVADAPEADASKPWRPRPGARRRGTDSAHVTGNADTAARAAAA